ncbi:MAG: hypothetical protein AABW99_02985 [archaeon]
MNEEIKKLVSETELLIEKNAPFRFWELLEKAEKILPSIEQKNFGVIEQGVVVQGKLFLGKGSIIKAGSRIEGNAFIGENCVIGPNAYLRKEVIIGNNCHVGTSEIKSSIILSNSNVPHFSYAGDSVIGRNCNLGAGTKIANLRHDNANVQVTINGEKIDSGKRKLGALLFDDVKTGINSSVNCGAILEKGSRLKPNEFRK